MQRMNVAMADELETKLHDVMERRVETWKRMEGPVAKIIDRILGDVGFLLSLASIFGSFYWLVFDRTWSMFNVLLIGYGVGMLLLIINVTVTLSRGEYSGWK
jgi:hypothetical protein